MTHRIKRLLWTVGASLIAAGSLSGCVSPPTRPVAVVAAPAPIARTFVYPARGQSAEQLERDRYDCYLSAVRQTGFDPSRPARAYEQVVVTPEPGVGTATGAVGGAILGSLLAGPRSAGLGLLLGGATGAIVGTAADASAQAQVSQAQSRVNEAQAAEGRRADEFRRVNSACLAARGYSVS